MLIHNPKFEKRYTKYGIPDKIRSQAIEYLDKVQIDILNKFEVKYGIIREKEAEKDTL